MDKILITGASGFVGRQIIPHLLKQNFRVLGSSRTQVQFDEHHPNFEFLPWKAPVGDLDLIRRMQNVKTLIHLGARAHILKDAAVDPAGEYMKANYEPTLKLAKICKDQGIKLIFMSTIKVLGESSEVALTETHRAEPADPYSVSKANTESALLEEQKQGLALLILRCPLIYGPGVKANFLRMMKIMDRSIPLPFAGVAAKRSILSTTNLAWVIDRVLEKGTEGILHVADPITPTLPDLLTKIAESLDRKPRLFKVPPFCLDWAFKLSGRQAEAQRLLQSLVVSTRRLQSTVGRPPFSLEQGLKDCAEWYRGLHA